MKTLIQKRIEALEALADAVGRWNSLSIHDPRMADILGELHQIHRTLADLGPDTLKQLIAKEITASGQLFQRSRMKNGRLIPDQRVPFDMISSVFGLCTLDLDDWAHSRRPAVRVNDYRNRHAIIYADRGPGSQWEIFRGIAGINRRRTEPVP